MAGGRALVTGASGFVGWHVVTALRRQGAEVRCLVRRSSRVDRLLPMGVELVIGDVRDGAGLDAAVAGVDVVYHVAGLKRALSRPALMAVNQGGVEHVARACAGATRPPVLVIVSSLAAVGPALSDRPRVETDRPAPVSNYGFSKLAGEQVASRWAGDVPISVVRPPIVLGEVDPDGFLMFRMLSRWGLHLVPAKGMAQVAVIHAEDLAAALILVAEQGARRTGPRTDSVDDQGIYFVAHDPHPTYADLGRMVGKAVGRPRVDVFHPFRPLVELAALAGELVGHLRGKAEFLNVDKFREVRAGSWTCDTTRIRTTLGFAPQRTLAERLRQTADWYRCEGWL